MPKKRKQDYEYDLGGMPFHHSLAKDVLLPCIKNLQRKPKILIIDGPPGTGKTTLGVHCVDWINNYFNKDEMLLGKDSIQLAQGGQQLMEKSELCNNEGYKVIIYDEADLDKRGSLTRYNANLFGFFREYRSLGLLIILIIQNVEWLDSRLWSLGAVVGLVHLKNPTKEYTEYEVYDMDNLSFLLYRMEKLGKFKMIKAYSFNKGYMRGQFLDLPPERRALLRGESDLQKKKSRKRRIEANNTPNAINKKGHNEDIQQK